MIKVIKLDFFQKNSCESVVDYLEQLDGAPEIAKQEVLWRTATPELERKRWQADWQSLRKWTGLVNSSDLERPPTLGDLREALNQEAACQIAVDHLRSWFDHQYPLLEAWYRSIVTTCMAELEHADDNKGLGGNDCFSSAAMKLYVHGLATTKLRELIAERLNNAWQQATPAPARARF